MTDTVNDDWDEEIKASSTLIIEEVGGKFKKWKKIEINAGGMINGRNKKMVLQFLVKEQKENRKILLLKKILLMILIIK